MGAPRTYDIPLPAASLQLTVTTATDVGAVRRVNEDSLLAVGPVFLVADGMGGHSFGDRASQSAVAAFQREVVPGRPAEIAHILELVQVANSDVIDLSSWAGEERVLSGTTLTGLALVETPAGAFAWLGFNVGDSRLYGYTSGHLTQLSVDHSVVQELVDAGAITPEQAHRHPDRNVVTRALGAAERADADVWSIPIQEQQTFLICSDGLSKEMTDSEIARVMRDHDGTSGSTVAEELVAAAVAAGGRDNVTVVVVESRLVGDLHTDAAQTLDRPPISAAFEDTMPRA